MLDTEPLLLVDDDEAKIGEDDVLAQDSMRSDDDIDLALLDLLEDFLGFGVGLEAAEALDFERIPGEALPECPLVLLGEHRRRHEHGDLFAEFHGLERRTNRKLRLAETDVAADEPIHRAMPAHVLLDELERA